MMYQTLKVALVVAALAVCGNVSAQDCGSCGTGVASSGQSFGFAGHGCGRAMTQQQAASLWAGYCNENCDYDGGRCGGCRGCGSRSCCGGCFGGKLRGGCGHRGGNCGCGQTTDCGCETVVDDCGGGGGCGCGRRGRLRGKFGGCGCKSRGGCDDGCGGCDAGGFGYPADCGCGCDDGAAGGCCGGLFGKKGRRNSCDECSSGCGGRHQGLFSRCKRRGSYFGECCDDGMQSCVAGCSDGCGGSPVVADPAAQGPASVVDAPVVDAPAAPADAN